MRIDVDRWCRSGDCKGRVTVAGGEGGVLQVFDLQDGSPVAKHRVAQDTVNGFSFHPWLPLAAVASGRPLPGFVLPLPLLRWTVYLSPGSSLHEGFAFHPAWIHAYHHWKQQSWPVCCFLCMIALI